MTTRHTDHRSYRDAVTGCSRGLSSRLATALNVETAPDDAGGQVRP